MNILNFCLQRLCLTLVLGLVGTAAFSAPDGYFYIHEGSDMSSPSREVPYESINGMAIHGDIIIGRVSQYSSDGAYSVFKAEPPPQMPDSMGQVDSVPSQYLYGTWTWPDSKIPIIIPLDIPYSVRLAITGAVEKLNTHLSKNSVKLRYKIVHSVLADSALAKGGNLVVTLAPQCASWVGRKVREKNQELWVGGDCAEGNIMHELLHAAGLEHTHARWDRDEFVEVLYENIPNDKHHNFDKLSIESLMPTPYDFNSLMHYSPTNFAIQIESDYDSGTVTGRAVNLSLRPWNEDMLDVMGQREKPSAGDIQSLRLLYGSYPIVPEAVPSLPNGQYALYPGGLVLQKWTQMKSCKVESPYEVAYANQGREMDQILKKVSYQILYKAWDGSKVCP